MSLEAGQKFAVAVRVKTPESTYPIAAEFALSEFGEAVDLSDGEGYISSDGRNWESVEDTQNSNLCLKVYACEKEIESEENQ